jgi:hypothetical protein
LVVVSLEPIYSRSQGLVCNVAAALCFEQRAARRELVLAICRAWNFLHACMHAPCSRTGGDLWRKQLEQLWRTEHAGM